MAEKEIKIKVTTETDIADLEQLDKILDNIQDKSGIKVEVDDSNLNVTVDKLDELENKLTEANAEVERLEDALAEAELNGDDIEADIIADELAEARDRVEELQSALDELDSTSVSPDVDDSSIDEATAKTEELDGDLDELEGKTVSPDVDDSSIEETKEKTEELNEELDETDNKTVKPDVDSSDVDDLKDKTKEASSAMDSLATAAAGIGVTAGVEQMVSTADRINTSWNQLELTFGSVTDKMKSDISSAASVTGRSGGEVRGYFNQMGIAGVTNTDLITSSFEALSGKAYQTGNSIESMETKMQTMVLSGNASARMLKSLGLSAEDLAQAMGVSADQVKEAFKNMTPEERLQAISKAMGDGAKANEMYKNSYQGLKAQADAAMAGLMGAVGQAILPVVVPALQAATNFVKLLTDGFKSLPGPVQAVVGGVLGFAGVALTVVGVLGTMGQMFKMVKGGLEALNLVTKLSKIYTEAAAAAQWLLNIAMDANPITIVVLAIIALIAVLGYLYFNNEQVRAAIDGLGQSFIQAGQIIYDSIMWAIDAAISALQGLWDYITTLGGLLPSNVSITGNQIIDTVLRVMAFIATLPAQLGMIYINIIAKALGFGDNFSQNMITGASNAVNGFVTWITSLPSKLKEELDRMLDMAGQFALDIADKLSFGGASMVLGWITGSGEHSPGYMYDALVEELLAMVNAPEMLRDMITGISDAGYEMANALSMAILGVDIDTAIMGWITTLQGLQDYMLTLGGLLPQSVNITGNQIIDTLLRVMGFIGTLPIQLGMYLTNMIAQALGFGTNFSQNMFNAGLNAVNNFVRSISNLSSGLVNELNEMISDALNFAGRIGQILWNAGINAITNFLNALDRHSPGIMQREFIAEISEMGTRVPSEGRKLVSNMGRLGSDVVDSFNPELGNVKVGNVSGGVGSSIGSGDFTINIYGDVDSEKRINDIIDAITKAMAWDNKTAGRTS